MKTQSKGSVKAVGCLLAMAVGIGLLIAGKAGATVIPVTNYSFEDPVLAVGGLAYYTHPGWSDVGGGVNGTSYEDPAWHALNRDGNNVLMGYGAVGNGVQQDLGVPFSAGLTYTLTVKIARPGQYYDWNVPHPSIGKISLNYADTGAEVASHTESIWVTDPAWGTMVDYSVVYTATAADAAHGIRIRLANMDSDGVYFDAVRLEAIAIPEPTSMGLLMVGALCLIAGRHARKASR